MARDGISDLARLQENTDGEFRLRRHLEVDRIRDDKRAIRDRERRRAAERKRLEGARVDRGASCRAVEWSCNRDVCDWEVGRSERVRDAETDARGWCCDVNGRPNGRVREDESGRVEGRVGEVRGLGQLRHGRPCRDPVSGRM